MTRWFARELYEGLGREMRACGGLATGDGGNGRAHQERVVGCYERGGLGGRVEGVYGRDVIEYIFCTLMRLYDKRFNSAKFTSHHVTTSSRLILATSMLSLLNNMTPCPASRFFRDPIEDSTDRRPP